ncbi:MAG: flippase-like domain-containing protein [Gemmatimonadetes bacterium]|nr:flippase-like domain-containing protein [Gemmatimonadota bacterium]
MSVGSSWGGRRLSGSVGGARGGWWAGFTDVQRGWSWGRVAVAGGVSGVLLWFLFSQISVADVTAVLKGASPGLLVVAGGFYVVATVIRAARFGLILEVPVRRLTDLTAVAFAQSMLNNVLPARVGELSFVLLARMTFGSPLARGVGTLIVMRLLDYLGLMVVFVGVSFPRLDDLAPGARVVVAGTTLLLLPALLATVVLARARREHLDRLMRVVPRMALGSGAVRRFRDAALESMGAFSVLRMRRALVVVGGETLLVWLAYFGMYQFLLLAIGVFLPVWQAVIASTLSIFAMAVPWISLAGFGIVESGWVAGLMLVGLEREPAIASAFALHVLTLLVVLPTGLWGWLRARWGGPEPASPDA